MILETLLKPFSHATRVALRPILHRQERINRAFLRRFKQVNIDLTLMQKALVDVRTYVSDHQGNTAADQTAVDALAAQFIAAVTPVTPVTPAAS